MSERYLNTPYHPRWLRRPVSTYWWLEKWSYRAFILREGSCLFVGWFVVYLLLLVNAVNQGPERYTRFIEWSATPWVLTLNIVSFLFIVYHAITFFEAAPQAMAVHVGRTPVPGSLVRGGALRGVGCRLGVRRLASPMIKRHPEPLLWMLFSAGGVVSGLLMPILLLLFGIAFPLGWLAAPTHTQLLNVLTHPLTRLVLLALCVLSLFHWAHRFRHTLYDGLQIKHLNEVIALLSYGFAIVGSGLAGYLMWQIP